MGNQSRRTKSVYADGVPPSNINIKGSKPPTSKKDLKLERISMLRVIAGIVLMSGGRIDVDAEVVMRMASGNHTLVIEENVDTGNFIIRFDEEKEDDTNGTGETGSFFDSDAAREAREFLANLQRERELRSGTDETVEVVGDSDSGVEGSGQTMGDEG